MAVSTKGDEDHPKLSIVITARNDGHAGDFLHRLNVSISSFAQLLDKQQLKTEYIIVEWNPPTERPQLEKVVSWPDSKYVDFRIIKVPQSIHKTFPESDRMPMYQFIGKNAGIRRAKSEWILATNADIVPTKPLINRITPDYLEESCFYRVNRFDVAGTVPFGLSVDDIIEYCEDNTFRVNTINGKIPSSKSQCFRCALSRFFRHPIGFMTNRRPWGSRCVVLLLKSFFKKSPNSDQINNPSRLEHLHRTASGDFILMAKKDWACIRGFPELTTQFHGDSWVCLKAAGNGYRQIVLDERIYHQEHQRDLHFDRPISDIQILRRNSARILNDDEPQIPDEIANGENWGLANAYLNDMIVK